MKEDEIARTMRFLWKNTGPSSGRYAGDFGDIPKCKDNIKLDFMMYDMMYPSTLVRPSAGHGVKMRSTQFQST